MPEKKKPGEAYDPSRKSKGGPYKTNINNGKGVGNPFQFKAKAKATQKTKVAKKPTKKRRA